MAKYATLTHTFGPLYDEQSKVLILGSFPSVKSREEGFYYGHPRNRFWVVIAAITHNQVPANIDEKKAMLLSSHIALWDIVWKCDIAGSSDSSIKKVIPSNLNVILDSTHIKQIFCNGKVSWKLFCKYQEEKLGRSAILLPSTSPANAMFSTRRLIEAWRCVDQALSDV